MTGPENDDFPYTSVVLTGGSSGIGKSFVSHIGKLKRDVFICNLSRREPEQVLDQLNLRHIETDLSDPASRGAALAQVLATLRERAPEGPVLLINNAGLGKFGTFGETDIASHQNLIEVNIAAVVELTAGLLPVLQARGGTIMNLASVVAFQPTPFMACYGATKAFVLQWSYALRAELAPQGVRVLAVCPGSTASEFHDRAGMQRGGWGDRFTQTSDQVVREALAALQTDRGHVVTGWLNKVQCALLSRLPLRLSTWLSHRVLSSYVPTKPAN
ncbi:SDR family NAD(P)-dependent oxidoreductase [Synoicihabitans lomoniglobus]|uniref:SDR family NAD(P)-dependent oxidoreductase n=1 Tax=Synoicihabitans lomoniglobus TaxID=2909285 RepID=A0AAF0CRZ8_9BACT|nr:SDR family NAD(P)-dependent oxidoreductase [Opitutaceae bacterium LMO-M01]WED67014.1 SDR family NAD(P)-dependent oxidoreductase [Opitutaceae bacterium LMO-M01]